MYADKISNIEVSCRVYLLIVDRKIDLPCRLVILFYSAGKIAETKDEELDRMDASHYQF